MQWYPRLFIVFGIIGVIGIIVPTLAYTATALSSQLFIISPAPGEVIIGKTVAVAIELPREIVLRDPQKFTARVENEGHLHLWLDALPAHDESISITLADKAEHILENVKPGLHTLYVEFVYSDHQPYAPRRSATVEFETVGEEIKPAVDQDGQVEAPPEVSGNLFIPAGKSRPALTLGIIGIIILILAYLFYRRGPRH